MEEYEVDLFEKYENKFTDIINDSNFLLQLRMGDEKLSEKCKNVDFLKFICENAFSNEYTLNTKICIDALEVFQSPIFNALLNEKDIFLSYFNSFSILSKSSKITIIRILNHGLISFLNETVDFILDNEIIMEILLKNITNSFYIQDFFLTFSNLNSEKMNQFFLTLLDYYINNNQKYPSIFDDDIIFLIIQSINLQIVDKNSLLKYLEIIIDKNLLITLKIALKLPHSELIYQKCIEKCCQDSFFNEQKVLSLKYLGNFPNELSNIIIENISKHFFEEQNNSLFHAAVLFFINQSISLSDKIKETIINSFKDKILNICKISNLNDNCPLTGFCFMIAKTLLPYVGEFEWKDSVSKRLFYWDNKTKQDKKAVSSFNLDFQSDSKPHLNPDPELNIIESRNGKSNEISIDNNSKNIKDEEKIPENILNDKKLFDFTAGIDISKFTLGFNENDVNDPLSDFKLPDLPF